MILAHKGIDIFYTDQGSGNAVVLLHGFLENSFTTYNEYIEIEDEIHI